MHGCGIKISEGTQGYNIQEGHFVDDEYLGLSNTCDALAAKQAAQKAAAAAQLACGFKVHLQQHVLL